MTMTRDQVLWALTPHTGKDNGVRARDLVREICGETDAAQERQLRHLIEALRREGQHICGHPATGYYIAASEDELMGTCLYLYHRAMTTLSQIAAMRRVSLPDLKGQLRIYLSTAPASAGRPAGGGA